MCAATRSAWTLCVSLFPCTIGRLRGFSEHKQLFRAGLILNLPSAIRSTLVWAAVQKSAGTGYSSYMALQQALNELDEDSKPENKPQPDVGELATLLEPFNVRSIALTGLFILAIFFTLKVASSFFIPVVLAILLNFVFASTIRTLGRLWISPPLAAFIVLGCFIGGVAFGIYQLAGPARAWMAKLPETAQQIERKFGDLKRSRP